MRNPIRLKNFRGRFLLLYLVGLLLLAIHPPSQRAGCWALPLIALGTALRAWGAGHLVKNDELTLGGPYAFLRHPLYLGTILIATGFGLWLGGAAALVVIAIVWPWFALDYFPRKERAEAERLAARYGERFARYRAAVPALWPRLSGGYREPSADRSALADADDRAIGRGAARWALARYSENNELGTLLAVVAACSIFWLRAALSG